MIEDLYADILQGSLTSIAVGIVFGFFIAIVVYISSIDK